MRPPGHRSGRGERRGTSNGVRSLPQPRIPIHLPPRQSAASSAALARPRAARPSITRAVLIALLGRLLGLAVLFASSGLLYDLASSPQFRVARLSVTGNRLVAPSEVEGLAALSGQNLFWLERSEIAERMRLLPPVDRAEVLLELPDHVVVQVSEREPVAIWVTGDVPFLVDREGVVLAARAASRPLTIVRDAVNQPVQPGQRVPADPINTATRLDGLLASAFGPQERQFVSSPDTGLQVLQAVGPRLIVGDGTQLEWKISTIEAISRHLEKTRVTAELIDVRFGDRPYFR